PEAWTMWRMTLVPLEKTMPFGLPTPSNVRQSQFLVEIDKLGPPATPGRFNTPRWGPGQALPFGHHSLAALQDH
ncbi:hypothetical protein, partial [Rhodoblastus acidophilus]|uniref:hypothetical protein n=1 Tax=Rhodoblastus acidophilus TaxID=1074 RepID=UPI002224CB51